MLVGSFSYNDISFLSSHWQTYFLIQSHLLHRSRRHRHRFFWHTKHPISPTIIFSSTPKHHISFWSASKFTANIQYVCTMLLHISVTCHPDDGRLSRLQFQFYPIHWFFLSLHWFHRAKNSVVFAFNSFQDARLFRLSFVFVVIFCPYFLLLLFSIVFSSILLLYTITTWPNRSSESIPSIRWLKC